MQGKGGGGGEWVVIRTEVSAPRKLFGLGAKRKGLKLG